MGGAGSSDDDAAERARLKRSLDQGLRRIVDREPSEEGFRHAYLAHKIVREAADRYATAEASAAARLKARLGLTFEQLGALVGLTRARAQAIAKKGRDPLELPSTPEPQPVVAAIVTSRLGVLVGKRNDGKPPWTFIAGEIEPGESPEDAAVREVKEETGCVVRAGSIIGRRVHPKTGRTMVYMSARPTHGTKVFVGDEDELAEVRWVASLAELDELMQPYGIFEPVHEHLGRALKA
jgi:8-oxo-dGTP diphosphatase